MVHLVDIFNVRITANKETDLSVDEQAAYEYMKADIIEQINYQVRLYPLFEVEIKP